VVCFLANILVIIARRYVLEHKEPISTSFEHIERVFGLFRLSFLWFIIALDVENGKRTITVLQIVSIFWLVKVSNRRRNIN